MTLWALIPVKAFTAAKTRLASALDAEERGLLARAMLKDTLQAVSGAARIDRIAVVTNDPAARKIAHQFGALAIAEPGLGLNSALEVGRQVLRKQGATAWLVLPADIPALRGGDVDTIANAGLGGLANIPVGVIVADREQKGTNALLLPASTDMPFRFGPDSFREHLRQAEAFGLPLRILPLDHVAIDCDHPADIRPLLAQNPGTKTVKALNAMGLTATDHRRLVP